MSPSQDMVIGCYYLTIVTARTARARAGCSAAANEAMMAYQLGQLSPAGAHQGAAGARI